MSTPAEPPVTTTTSAAFRPWPQFLDLSALSLPISLSESTYRVTQNLRYFLPNYVVLTFIFFLLTLLTRPLSLILFLGISAAWAYLVLARDEPLTVLDYDIDQRFVVGFLAFITLGALFWTHLWMKLFVSLIIGAVIVLVHGIMGF